jgi:hypothetical protein
MLKQIVPIDVKPPVEDSSLPGIEKGVLYKEVLS